MVSIHGQQKIHLDIKVFLEGPLDVKRGLMHTRLYQLGYLPGMKPKSFFGKAVPFQDPYGNDDLKTDRSTFIYEEGSVDWILISVADAQSGEVIWRKSAVLQEDGTLHALSLSPRLLDDRSTYIVTVTHRNQTPAISGAIKVKEGRLEYDFTKDISSEWLKDIDGIAVMKAGNIAQTELGIVDEQDLAQWSKMNGKNSSYYLEDVDLNGDISVKDQSLILSNMRHQ